MITETIFAPAARSDLSRLDRQIAQRVLGAVQRYAVTGQGNITRLQGTGDEMRLRVGDRRVRFTDRVIVRSAEPPATDAAHVRVIEVLRVLPRGRAYRDWVRVR